jgi:hypothetical protein
MPASLLYGTVLFFLLVMGLSFALPFRYYIRQDHKKMAHKH